MWLIDVHSLMRASVPVTSLLAALLLHTVNPSCLLHVGPLPPALCYLSSIPPLLLRRISFAGRLICGVAVTPASVTSEDLGAVAG